MVAATVIFLHGKESGPWGPKIRALARVAEKLECRVVSNDDQGIADPGQRVQRLVDSAATSTAPLVLVGSSMGGYVATVASSTLSPRGLFLMAPAFGMAGYQEQSPAPVAEEVMIIHGWDDEVVPFDNVFRFAREHRCRLCMVPDGHSLHGEIDVIEQAFGEFLLRCLDSPCRASERARLLAAL